VWPAAASITGASARARATQSRLAIVDNVHPQIPPASRQS
jgi:hypothetical protein